VIIKKRVCIASVVFVGEGLSMLITCRFSSLLLFIYQRQVCRGQCSHAMHTAAAAAASSQQQSFAYRSCHTHTATTDQYKRAKTTFIFPLSCSSPLLMLHQVRLNSKRKKKKKKKKKIQSFYTRLPLVT